MCEGVRGCVNIQGDRQEGMCEGVLYFFFVNEEPVAYGGKGTTQYEGVCVRGCIYVCVRGCVNT